MTISRSSFLHYWSSRSGPIPVIGGAPVHSRNSAGGVGDVRGEYYSAIINTPRFEWNTDKATAANERRAMLLLELSRANDCPFSNDFSNAAWVKSNCTVATGILDPAGGTTACTLTSTAANGQATQTLAAGASLARVNSAYVRRRTGSGAIQLLQADSLAFVTVPVTPEWTRVDLLSGANTLRAVGVRLVTSGDAVDVWLSQHETGGFSTSGIQTPTSASVARAVDSFYWNFLAPPQGLMVYDRFVERGTVSALGARWAITSAAAGDPQLMSYAPAGLYTALHNNGTASVTSALAAAGQIGDTCELVTLLTGGGAVQVIQSINGAAVSSGALSAANALAAAWADRRLWLNSEGTAKVGASASADLRIVKYADVVATSAQGIMDELRAAELGLSGEVL